MGNSLKSYSGKRSILLKQLALGTAVLANDEVGEFGVRVSDVDRDLQFFFIDKHYMQPPYISHGQGPWIHSQVFSVLASGVKGPKSDWYFCFSILEDSAYS